jgi:hypothetical protein
LTAEKLFTQALIYEKGKATEFIRVEVCIKISLAQKTLSNKSQGIF